MGSPRHGRSEPHPHRLDLVGRSPLKLVLVPLTVGPIAAAGLALWFSGYCWPIATTFARCFMREAVTEFDEADVAA